MKRIKLLCTSMLLLCLLGCQTAVDTQSSQKEIDSSNTTVPLQDELNFGWPSITSDSPDASVAKHFVGQSVDSMTKQVLTSPFTFSPTSYQFVRASIPISTTVTLIRDEVEWLKIIPEVERTFSPGEFNIAVKTVMPVGTFSVLPDGLTTSVKQIADPSMFYHLYGSQIATNSRIQIYITYVFCYKILPEAISETDVVQKSVYDAIRRMLNSKNTIQLSDFVLEKLATRGTYGYSIFTNMNDTNWSEPSNLPVSGEEFQTTIISLIDRISNTEVWQSLPGESQFTPYLNLEIFKQELPDISRGLEIILSNLPQKNTWIAAWIVLRNQMQEILEKSVDANLRTLALACRNVCDLEISRVNQNSIIARQPSDNEFMEIIDAWKSEKKT